MNEQTNHLLKEKQNWPEEPEESVFPLSMKKIDGIIEQEEN